MVIVSKSCQLFTPIYMKKSRSVSHRAAFFVWISAVIFASKTGIFGLNTQK